MRAIKGQLIMYTSQHVSGIIIVVILITKIVIIVIINKIVINVILQHHYSIKGGASAIGLGTDNCVQVMCDEK